MKKLYYPRNIILIIIVMLTAGSIKLHAQLTVDNTTLTPQQLVQNILIGQGVTVSNVTFSGNSLQFGQFTSNGSNLGLNSGIVMSSGYATVSAGPNDGSATSEPMGGINSLTPTPDPNLTTLAASIGNPNPTLYDAAILEFDFVPTSDSLTFKYVWGSDEYTEFSSSPTFNDVFGFFLSGVTVPFPQTNIALVPGTSQPVSILNISDVVNTQYYVDNDYVFLPTGTVEYDGFTVVLTARAQVICGETYHIKLAIADAGDGSYDSGVFLQAGSFSSIGSVQILPNVSYSSNDTVMYEGCGDATIAFIRSGDNTQAQNYTYTLSGTATNGVDYNNLNGQITIPAGQDTAFITLNPVTDGSAEGQETLIITVTNTVCNNSNSSSVTIYINDVLPLTVNAGPDQSTACTGGGNINLNATPANGVPTYTYSWAPTGDLTQGITVLPANTTTYTVTVTDLCGNQATDDVTVSVELPAPLTMTVGNDTIICQNTTATLIANPQGGNGTVNVVWSTGEQGNSIQVSPMVTSIYTVTATDACNQTVTGDITVTVEPNNAAFDYFFTSNNAVTFDNQSIGYDNLVWWDFGDSTTSTTFEPSHTYTSPGTYVVTLVVENSAGCLDTIQYSLVVRPDFYFYIPNSFTPNSDGINEGFNGKGQGFEVYNMSIYNRWGQRIFQTNSLTNGWLGLDANDNPVPIDTYVYVVSLRITPDEDEIIYRGKVSLIR
ncbi:MAG: choice-of-anchor L domain-containing protein [Sphingobacteriales bacterium JAD_PAG50586_3]|nr:MAG: choice-of-anchor L domain-containing protein [Sphingobacteriales bacterium JAD_PAG50586_3]